MSKSLKSQLSFFRCLLFFHIVLVQLSCNALHDPKSNVRSIPSEYLEYGNIGLPTSVTPVGSDQLLISDYKNIFFVDIKKKSVSQVKFDIQLTSKAIDSYNGNFHPTGIFYDANSHVLFVTNYQVSNILLFNWNKQTNIASFLYEIKDVNLKGPEGLKYDNETNTLFVTDIYSHFTLAFRINLEARTYEKVWETPVNIAHGIDYKYGRLFITSLLDRSVIELDPKTGNYIKTFGGIGMGKETLEFLWPAFVFINSPNTILISDGHTGYIKEIETSTLKVTKVNGGNGPGHTYFHNPGCFWHDGKSLGVASIYSFKIVYLNEDDLSIKKNIYFKKNNFSFDSKGILEQVHPVPHIFNWSISPLGYGYENIHKKINFGSKIFHLGYSRLVPENSNIALRMPLSFPNEPVFGNISQHYFLDSMDINDGKIIFSYNSPYIIVIFFKNNSIQAFPILLDQQEPVWLIKDKVLINSIGHPTVKEIPLNLKLLELEKIAEESSKMPLKDKISLITRFCRDALGHKETLKENFFLIARFYLKAFRDNPYFSNILKDIEINNIESNLSYIKPVFSSSYGVEFFKTMRNNIDSDDDTVLTEAAEKYFQGIFSSSGEFGLEEFLIICFFSGIYPIDKTLEK